MTLREVKGQEKAVAALRAALAKGVVHHAWLFTGLDGIGKELAAVGLAQALLCTEEPKEGCGHCAACKRILKRNHPDVTWLMPEDELVRRGLAGRSDFDRTPSRDIRIEQIRGLQERLAFRPLEGDTKLALLVGAHAMNPSAQNALLKTLEEPPRGTVMVLISSAPDKLLPTIRSRCAKANFGPLPSDVIEERVQSLSKMDAATAKQVALMAGGSLRRALELDTKTLTKRRELIEAFEALERTDARGWIALAETLAEDKTKAEAALEVLAVWLRDVAVAQVGGQVVNADLSGLATKAGQRISAAGLARRAHVLGEAQNAISQRNGATKLQLERMLIEMMAA